MSTAHAISLNAVGNALPPLAALITAPIMARALGVPGRGQVTAATAPLLLLTTVGTAGIPEATSFVLARRPGVTRALIKRAVALLILIGVVASLALLLLAGPLGAGNRSLPGEIALTAWVAIPTLALAALRGGASGRGMWRAVATEQAIAGGIRLTGLVGLLLVGELTIRNAIFVVVLGPLAGAVAYVPLLREPHDTMKLHRSTRQLISFGSRFWVGSVAGIALLRLDQAIMAPLSNTYQLGLYAVAVSISEAPLIISSAVSNVVFVSHATDRDDHRMALQARIGSSATFIAGALLATSSFLWLPAVFGHAFVASEPPLFVLTLGVVAATPGAIAGAGLGATGRPELRSAALVVASLVNFLLLLVLVPSSGAMGAAVATLVGNFVASHTNIIFLSRLSRMRPSEFYGLRREDVALLWRALRNAGRARRWSSGGTAPMWHAGRRPPSQSTNDSHSAITDSDD